ncbi:MAG: ABC transporter permease [bacterium]
MTRNDNLRAFATRNALGLAMTVFVILFAAAEPAFLKPENLIGILRSQALVAIMATGMTFVIMTGGVDLSVGPVLALSGVVNFYVMDAGWGLPLSMSAAIATGLLIGAANGTLIAALNLPPIIVTLAALSIVRGSALLLGGPDLHSIRGQPVFTFLGSGQLFGLPFSVVIAAVVAALMIFVQKLTPLGLLVAAIGENERAAWLSGLRVRRVKVLLYGLCSAGAALAGLIQTSQVHTAAATYGEFGTELDVIAAVVLGGTSLSGGTGSVARTMLGVLFLGILNNGMSIMNMPINLQLIAKGIIIAGALAAAQRSAD